MPFPLSTLPCLGGRKRRDDNFTAVDAAADSEVVTLHPTSRARSSQKSAHFAQVYEDWPFLERGPALVVASRDDGVHFYQIPKSPGKDEQPRRVGSWSPPCGEIDGSWSPGWRADVEGGSVCRNYKITPFPRGDARVAMEGHARYGNIFVVVAIGRGSAQAKKPWYFCGLEQCLCKRGWYSPPCLRLSDGRYRPVLFVFDLSQPQDWSAPEPQVAIPLFGWSAALHVSLFVPPAAPGAAREELRAVVSSGFHQGLGILGDALCHCCPGHLMAPLVATRSGTGRVLQGSQRSSSWGGEAPGDWDRDWEVDMRSSCDPREQDRCTASLPGVWFPEGVTVWQPAPEKTYAITAGVQGGVAVADFSSAAHGAEPQVLQLPPKHATAYRQLVGRTWFGERGTLLGALADWSEVGGLVVAGLDAASGIPTFAEARSRTTSKANRIVLIDAVGNHTGHSLARGGLGSIALAVVPLEQPCGRFALYDIRDPASPRLVAISEALDDIGETYCLEVYATGPPSYAAEDLAPGSVFRIVIMTAPEPRPGAASDWWYFDVLYDGESWVNAH